MILFPTKSSVRAAYYRVVRKGYHYSHKISKALKVRHISILSSALLIMLLVACSTQRQVTTQLVERTTVDTIYLNTLQYDSIFISQDHFIDRSSDTIYIRDVSVEYKYKLLRDTIRLHQVDSIPVIKEVEVIRTERYIPWWSKALNWLGLAALAAIFVQFVIFVFKLKKL